CEGCTPCSCWPASPESGSSSRKSSSSKSWKPRAIGWCSASRHPRTCRSVATPARPGIGRRRPVDGTGPARPCPGDLIIQKPNEAEGLAESDGLYRDLYENAPNPYLIVGVDGRILRVNRRVTEVLGYSASELVGAPVHSFMADTPAGIGRSMEISRKHLAGESVVGWEL